jgi:hypothetical protein
VIGSVGETGFRTGAGGPALVKRSAVQVINDGPQKRWRNGQTAGQHLRSDGERENHADPDQDLVCRHASLR